MSRARSTRWRRSWPPDEAPHPHHRRAGRRRGDRRRGADIVEPLAHVIDWLEPVGTIFIRLITMVVVPLVIASLFVGVASLGDVRRLGRIGGWTLVYFLGTTALAAIIGTAVALAAGVGAGLDPSVRDAIAGRFASAGSERQRRRGLGAVAPADGHGHGAAESHRRRGAGRPARGHLRGRPLWRGGDDAGCGAPAAARRVLLRRE